MDVHKTESKPQSPPSGYRPLDEVAEREGISHRQLWRKVRAGEISGAVQTKGGHWYVPPDAEIPVKRKTITSQMQSRIRRALIQEEPPKAIARRERLSERTVQRMRRELEAELYTQAREREEQLESINNSAEGVVSGIWLRGGAVIKAISTEMPDGSTWDEADEEILAMKLPEIRGYVNLSQNIIYVSQEQLVEMVEWEDARGG